MQEPNSMTACIWEPRLLLAFLGVLALVTLPASATPSDVELLLDLKDTFSNGDTILQSWNGTEPCSTVWTGIVCNDGGEVTEIVLDEKGLVGTMPPAGWVLPPALSKFSIWYNYIFGTLPADWKLPKGLTRLDLGVNFLTSTIPASLELPDSITFLGFYYNRFNGSFPATLKLPTSLERFYVSWNDLTGKLPTELVLPPNLTWADFGANRFEGPLPTGWQLPSKLERLDLSNNLLTGTIPEIWDLPASLSVSGLSLNNNSLSGTLPNWPDLTGVPVYITPGNRWLCGKVPKFPLYSDYALDSVGALVQDPPQVSSLPECMNDTQRLLQFKRAFNNSDVVLSSWSGSNACQGGWMGVECDNSGRVIRISLTNRGLQGSIPFFGWPPLPYKLKELTLQDNFLSGSVPPGLSFPPALRVLNLVENRLSGTLRPERTLPANLESLLLDKNQLTGSIPADLFWWIVLPSRLRELGLSVNRLTGTIALAPTLTLPSTLETIFWNENQLNGTISPDWKLPPSLQWLNLSSNALSGSLPSGWGLPPSLSVQGVALDQNQLTGTLPTLPGASGVPFFVLPGNVDLCGSVPASPNYYISGAGIDSNQKLTSLPSCTPPKSNSSSSSSASSSQEGSSSSSGSNTAAIVGGVVGGVAAAALLSGILLWVLRRRKPQDGKGQLASTELPGKDLENAFVHAASEQSHQSTGSWPGKGDPGQLSPKSGRTVSGPLTPSVDSQQSNRPSDDPEDLLSTDILLATIVSQLQPLSTYSGSSSESTPAKRTRSQQLDVHMDTWQIPFCQLKLMKQIGKGSFGRVYLGKFNETLVAVKLLLDPSVAGEGNIQLAARMALSHDNPVMYNLKQEASTMAALRHPNILNFLGTCDAPPCLISEYCPRGSLYDTLQQARSMPAIAEQLGWPARLRMAMGAALGMLHLHSFKPGLVHRDLKSPNLLVSSDWAIKVADFNLTRIMGENTASSCTGVTNPRWLAPEVLKGELHTFASDVYSYGMVLWELLTWQLPWKDAANPWQIIKAVTEGQRPVIPTPEELPANTGDWVGLDGYIGLIQKCWADKPEDRPDFKHIVAELRKLAALPVGVGGNSADNHSSSPPGSGGSSEIRVLKSVRCK